MFKKGCVRLGDGWCLLSLGESYVLANTIEGAIIISGKATTIMNVIKYVIPTGNQLRKLQFIEAIAILGKPPRAGAS